MAISRWRPQFDWALGNAIIDQIEKAIEAITPPHRTAAHLVAGTVDATIRDRFMVADMTAANVTITLPAVNDWMIARGHDITIKKGGAANTLTIQRSGSDTIDGATSMAVTRDRTAVRFVAATGGWLIESAFSTITTL